MPDINVTERKSKCPQCHSEHIRYCNTGNEYISFVYQPIMQADGVMDNKAESVICRVYETLCLECGLITRKILNDDLKKISRFKDIVKVDLLL